MAASSWLAGRQDFFVDTVTERPSTTTTTTKSNKRTVVCSSDVSVTYSFNSCPCYNMLD